MKSMFFVVVSMLFLFTACSTNNKTEKEASKGRINMLLSNSVPVSQVFIFDSVTIPAWQKGLKANDFIHTVFEKVMNSEITVYDPNADDTSHIKSTNDDILNRLNQQKGLLNLNEIKSIFFKEEWFLDTANPVLFEKKVLCWYPVRHYQTENVDKMKLIFKATGGGNPTELLAKNVIYEFNLEDSLNPENTNSINILKFSELIVNKALSGKIKVFDPMDINKQLSHEDINHRMGVVTDTLYVDDANTGESVKTIIKTEIDYSTIRSIVFIEDWYYNPQTYAIKKVITGIAPVRHYSKGDESVKSVAFVMYFGNEKTKLFN